MLKIYREPEKFLNLIKRREKGFQNVMSEAAGIVSEIETRGEAALLEFVRRFDGFSASSASELLVKNREVERAYSLAGKGFIESIKRAVKNVEDFHSRQK